MNRLANCNANLILIVLLIATSGSQSQPGTANGAAKEAAAAPAQAPAPAVGKQYSPFAGQTFPDRVLWGSAHIHTAFSFDSGLMGVTLGPDKLFEFSRGKEVVLDSGQHIQLDRPFDWLSITDHAEYLGIAQELHDGSPALLANPVGKSWYETSRKGPADATRLGIQVIMSIGTGKPLIEANQLVASAWARAVDLAEQYNQPGVFTTLNGFEWTSMPDGNNLHRTVIFRDGAERAKQAVPFSAFDSEDPAALWQYMDAYEKKTSGRVLAIPHNSNLSNGLAFTRETFDHKPIDRAYAEARILHEPLMEVTQIKGTSEAHPSLSPTDEFANWEIWDFGNLANPSVPKQKSMLQYEYARSALKNGLEMEGTLGANPYKFGMVGGNDGHLGVLTPREDNNFNDFRLSEPYPDRWKAELTKKPDGTPAVSVWQDAASGLTAVWSRDNTRDAVWDALARKEVYATTGDRPVIRVFAGWDFKPNDLERPDFAANGYSGGVPMGGDLKSAPSGKTPVFMVHAMRDPDGPNLDRIQVIKGWVGKDGKAQERIFDVAVSGGRKIGPDGRCKTPVGSTVDVANATYLNTIGAPTLAAYWKDPAFDAKERAFYYVRVIQIPSPRWTAYDQKRFGVKMPDYVPMTVTDRAYTSPIWYTP